MSNTQSSVAQVVEKNIADHGGDLVISGADFGSAGLTALFEAYLPLGQVDDTVSGEKEATLTVTRAIQGSTAGGQLGDGTMNAGTTVSGTGGAGPFQGMGISLVFSVVGDDVVLQLLAFTQPGWTFAASFSALEGTMFEQLVFSPGSGFYFASQDGGGFQEGLFFKGELQFTGALELASWLLGDGSAATVSGAIGMHQSVPEISLSATMAAGVTLGWFQAAPVTLWVISSLGTAPVDKLPMPVTHLRLDSAIRFHTSATDVVIPISAEFFPLNTRIQFQADLNDLLYLGFSELQSLVNGCDLSVIQFPAGFDLSQVIALQTFVLQVNLSAPTMAEKVSRVLVGVRSAQPWSLLSDPTFGTVLTINQISVSFAVDSPMSSPTVGCAIFGDIGLSEAGSVALSAVYSNNFTVNGELSEGTAINLTQLAAYFLHSAPNPDIPPIEVRTLKFSATPSTSDYSLAVAVEHAWQFSIGSTQLRVDELSFAMKTAPGGTSARLGGIVAIGPAILTMDWHLPGTFSLNGVIKSIALTELVHSLSPDGSSWFESFPVITLLNTSVAIQRWQDGGYFLAAGTQVDHFGTFEIEFSEVSKRTAFTFGFSLQPDWRLPMLSSVFDVALLRDLTFRNATLIASSSDNPNFSFRGLAPQSGNNLTPIAPSNPQGVKAGVYLNAELLLTADSGDALSTVAKLLSGLDSLVLSLAIPADYSQTVFMAQIQSHFSLFNTVTLTALSVTIRPFQESLLLAMDVTFDIHGHQLGLEGAIDVEGADVQISLLTTTPWVEPFGIKGLTLQAMAVGFVLDNLAVNLLGQVKLGSGTRSITLTAAMEFSLAEEIPDVFMVQEEGSVTLADVVHAFVATSYVPSQLSAIELFSFQFLIVANPVGWTDLVTRKHYGAGVAFAGRLRICSLVASVAVQVDYVTGIHVSGQIEAPLRIGNVVTIASATDPTAGPFVQVNSSQAPYASLSIALSLYEIASLKALATVGNNSFSFSFDYNLTSSTVGTLHASASLINGSQFNLAANMRVDVPSFGPINVGPYSLGWLASGFSVSGAITLNIGPGVAIAFSVAGGFVLGGFNMTLPPFSVGLSHGQFSGFAQLPAYFVAVLKDQLWSVGSALFQNATALFSYVRSAGLTLANDIGRILANYLHIDISHAAQYLAHVASVMRYSVTEVASLLKSGFNAAADVIASALVSARYVLEDVATAIGSLFRMEAAAVAEVLRSIGSALEDIAKVLKNVFGYSAKQAAEFFKQAWKIADDLVMDVLGAAKYAEDKIEDAMKDVFNWTSKVLHKAEDALNPSHW